MKKALSMMLVAALILSMGVSALAAEPISTTASEKVEITFSANVQPQNIEAFVAENNISMDSFTITVDDTINSGYVINEQADFDILWENFVMMQTSLLSEGIASNSTSQASSDMQTMLEALNSNNFQMSIVCDNPTALTRSRLIGADIVESIQPQPIATQTAAVKEENSVSDASASANNWLPTSGSASAWSSQNVSDATYLEVRYEWESASDLSTLTNDSDSTLEADLVFYNYDNEALATGWYTGGNYTYNTNQPRAYQDTQAFDNTDEPVFTIGCSDASALEAKTEYYWIAYGNETGSDGCKAKLSFQRGNRLIDSVYEETWNIFAEETVIVIPFSSWNTATSGTAYFN